MTLEQKIKKLIRERGTISVHHYMQLALADPEFGYYTQKMPIGMQGDFITAPEISQMFGELIGTWFIAGWQSIDHPQDFTLAELGPGKGTLMKDLLRVTNKLPSFMQAADVHMVEINPELKEQQRLSLAPYDIDISWYDSLLPLPEKPLMLIANEFFDALPIHQLQLTDNGWRERMITLDNNGELCFSLSETETPHCALAPTQQNIESGAIYEISPEAIAVTQQIAQHINRFGGIALFIDYGYYTQNYVDTLQSVKNHQYHHVLETPGHADLTMLVDFEKLAQTAQAENTKVFYNTTQGDFLRNMGIDIRLSMLCKMASLEQQDQLKKDVYRLTSPEEMGTLFKCMAISSSSTPPLFGFNDVYA